MNHRSVIRLSTIAGVLIAFIAWDRTGGNVAARMTAWLESMAAGSPMIVLATGALVYAVLLGIPFVPGVELGWCIMAVYGGPGVLVTYAATVLGLNLAFALGRWMPSHWPPPRMMQAVARRYGGGAGILPSADAGAGRWGRFVHVFRTLLLGHPLLMLAALFNAPGNFVLGGGGGLGMLAGMTKLRWRWYALMVIFATAPVPLMIGLGLLQLEALLAAP